MGDNTSTPGEQSVHLVVTCANRKRGSLSSTLRARELPQNQDTQARCHDWIRRIATGAAATRAADLYAGEYWQVVKQLGAVVGPSASMWVCSAGYGLMPEDAPIAAYAATFTFGQKDSVASTTDDARMWWGALAEWTGPAPGAPRTFTDLAASNPDAVVIAVMSDAYLRPCAHDLQRAAEKLADPDNFVIIGPGYRYPGLENFIVPVTAAVQPAVGGSLLSLHARAARRVLEMARKQQKPFTRPTLAALMKELRESAPPVISRVPGARLSDDEVFAFIRAAIVEEAGPVSATRLLRRLRSSGRSCEQARFKGLFQKIMQEDALKDWS
ncbi:hypothetical protein ACH35V_17170 [Actinomadura sp. 1N219]|uniref:hypothetical protein n=1 Tax=Actinomadura sp. 1N219 TaxID=3375152 RepID=UPI0037B7E67E